MAISTINSSGLNQAGDTVFCTTSGNVGIGTSSPSYKLDAQTTATGTAAGDNTVGYFGSLASGRDANIRFGDSVNASARIGYLSGALYMYTNGSERARIDSSGNFLFNCTGYTGDTTNVDGSAALGGGNFKFRKGASGWQWLQFYGTNTASGIGAIQNSSNTGVQYLTTSDYRLKTEVQPMAGALEKVAQLKPCTYTWVSTQEQGQGFIAHELQEVVPDAVAGEKDAVNEDGSIKPQSIDTSFLVATLTAAIQELKAIVDAQGAEIAALKGQP